MQRGTDVVVGYVETTAGHGPRELVKGLEVVPRANLHYRGTVFEEMDLDAVLARHPPVVAGRRARPHQRPGKPQRQALAGRGGAAEAGIEVITTVNVQHLESLNDVIEGITGVRQLETVPDEVVRAADQIELVDMTPEALRRRMAHGNIYPPEKVDAALANYFRRWQPDGAARARAALDGRPGRRGTASATAQTTTSSSIWATASASWSPSAGGPESATLMRRAARIASRRAGGEWEALYVTRQDGLTGVAPDRLEALRAKAEELGGTFHTVVGDDAAEAILEFARAENASQIIIGASRRGGVSTLLRPGVGERVHRGIRRDRRPRRRATTLRARPRQEPTDPGIASAGDAWPSATYSEPWSR